jgi:hypothetical protein
MAPTYLQKTVKENSRATNLLPVLICAVALPLSMIMWFGNLAFSFFAGGANAIHHEGKNVFVYLFFVLQFFGIFSIVCVIYPLQYHYENTCM